MINPDFLRTFIKFSEIKSFVGTARVLQMTQPGVSQHIKWLEKYFGMALLSRHGKRFELTGEGKKVLQYAKALYEKHEEFMGVLGVDDPHSGECRFSGPPSFGDHMYEFLLGLNKKYPSLRIHFNYESNDTIKESISAGEIDVGFMSVKPGDSILSYKYLNEEKLCLIVPAKFRDFSFMELKSLGFINHPEGFFQASRVLSLNYPREFRGMEHIPVSGFHNRIYRVLEPVALGLGFTVLPQLACRAFPQQNRIKYFPLKKEVRNVIYEVRKRYQKLPERFNFILEQYRKFFLNINQT